MLPRSRPFFLLDLEVGGGCLLVLEECAEVEIGVATVWVTGEGVAMKAVRAAA